MTERPYKLPTEVLEVLSEPAKELGLGLSSLTAIFDERDQDLMVLGEVTATRDDEDERAFELVVAVYDSNCDLIAEESSGVFRPARFQGFDTFKIVVFDLLSPPWRVRVFPREVR